jgi:hypothetical protein
MAMTRETTLYVEVPHEELMRGHEPIVCRKRHWHEHINFFSECGLAALLTNCGFVVLGTKEIHVSVGGKHAHQLAIACRRGDWS